MEMACDDIYGNWTRYREYFVAKVKERLRGGHTFRDDLEPLVEDSFLAVRRGSEPTAVHEWVPDPDSDLEESSSSASSELQTNPPTASIQASVATLGRQLAGSSLGPTAENPSGVVDVPFDEVDQSTHAGARSGYSQ